MKTLLIAIFLTSFSSFAQVGFKNGNSRTSLLSQGYITINCSGSGNVGSGPGIGSFTCQEAILLQGEYDYFIGPSGVDADKVTLTAIHEDGSQRSKTSQYNGEKGTSKDDFNLWISTLFQRPLLDYGENTIAYTLTKDGKSILQGVFKVTVADGGKSVCTNRGFYYSSDNMDCQNGGTYCSHFFRENNYCIK